PEKKAAPSGAALVRFLATLVNDWAVVQLVPHRRAEEQRLLDSLGLVDALQRLPLRRVDRGLVHTARGCSHALDRVGVVGIRRDGCETTGDIEIGAPIPFVRGDTEANRVRDHASVRVKGVQESALVAGSVPRTNTGAHAVSIRRHIVALTAVPLR